MTGVSEHLGNFGGGGKFDATASRLAVNANADLHLVFAQIKGWLAGSRHGAGGQRHAHAASLIIDFTSQGGHLSEGSARLRQATDDFFQKYGNADAAPSRRIEAILHSNIVIGNNAFHLDAVGGGQFGGHFKVEHVTGIVFDNMEHTGPTIDGTCRGKHLVRHGRGKDCSGAGCIEHAIADEAAMHRFVTAAATRDDTYFPLYRGHLCAQ